MKKKSILIIFLALLLLGFSWFLGGFFGIVIVFLTELFAFCIIKRLKEEVKINSALEQDKPLQNQNEPFNGATYLCAILMFCTKNIETASLYMKNSFNDQYPFDYNLLCSIAQTQNANIDLLVEHLACALKQNASGDLYKKVFSTLFAAELSWNKSNDGNKPSKYLADLLNYTI